MLVADEAVQGAGESGERTAGEAAEEVGSVMGLVANRRVKRVHYFLVYYKVSN